MTDPTERGAERLQVPLDHGDAVELDGGVVTVDGEASPSVLLRLAPWRARSLAHVLAEWSAVSHIFDSRARRPSLDELELSRTLAAAAAALDSDEPVVRQPRGPRVVPSRQRLLAIAVLAERETRLSALQRLAVIDATAWWLSEEQAGAELAYALLGASCMAETTAEHAYLALIDAQPDVDDQARGRPE